MNPPNDDQERVQALLESGHITRDEADILMAALAADPEVEAVLGATDARDPVYPEPPSPPQPNIPEPPSPPEPPTDPELRGASEPRDARWVKVEMFAGNLEVEVDPSLTAPTFEGQADLEQQGRDYKVRQQRPKSSGLLENVLENTLNAFFETKKLVVRIPEGYGVDLDMKAGNAEIRGVPTLRGKMMAGNLNAWELGGIALDLKAGNLDASLKLTEGQHTLDLKAGGGRIRLLPGSDVEVVGEVKAGNFRSRHPVFQYRRSYVGGTFHGTLGSGRASFTVQQKAGNLELEVLDDRAA